MIIIPARLASTRMPNKILREINGVPMFIATARRVSAADEVAIAADDEGVAQIAQKFGFKAVMTSRAHQSGTDRINEAADMLGVKDSEIIINVQADEPFIEPENIVKFREFCEKNAARAFMFSCFKFMGSELADDKNLVKVVTDDAGYALYFSRSRIPFDRAASDADKAHLGIDRSRAATLNRFCSFAPSTLENTEKLEQLRALSNGEKILMLEVQSDSIGIDCEDDLQRAQAKFGIEVN